jgi:ABC-type proline/glycine betaine transport system substrate-binding protein
MLITIAALVVAVGAVMFYKARAAGRVDLADLGWMSEQWLAEHRASHHS